jgi:ABC-type Na+ efflux pump permease subunit
VSVQQCTATPTSVLDLPLVLFGPRRVFGRVEDVQRWGWPLVILLGLLTFTGWATVLVDYEVAKAVELRKAQIEKDMHDLVELPRLRELYQEQDKAGVFWTRLARAQAVVAPPAILLVSVLLLASLLYGVVALTGRKPEWHTLLTVCVLAASVDALRALMQFGLVLHFRTLNVDTSLAPLAALWQTDGGQNGRQLALLAGAFGAVDPFRIWFWLLIGTGLSATLQLRGWRMWTLCILCWLVAAVVRTAVLMSARPGAFA